MRPKFIVYCLSAICLLFGLKGFELNKDIQNTLKENARQSESSIMEIGMCFDWYGVIIVNSVIQVSHGIITPEEMIEILEEERINKNEYLEGYKKDITPDEKEFANFVFAQEEKIKTYVDKLLVWAESGDIDQIKATVPEMYKMTDPTIEAINNIMDTKMYYNEEQSEILNKKIERFSDFICTLLALCFVMSICASFSKKCV
jgi:soluble cytochrome b562